MVGKDGESKYISGRTRLWLKVKGHPQQEAIICGYTAPKGARTAFGALVLGVYDDKGELVYVGHAGTGFDEKGLKRLYQRFQPLVTDRSPFKTKIKTNAAVTWLRPELVCEVKFAEWTNEGLMRQPVFLGLREDKRPEEVHREG